MSDLDHEEIFRLEFHDVQKRLEDPDNSLHESYLLGVSSGIVIMATHLGIILRPELLKDSENGS
jgi:hypothetical protein